jgi:hypothetical protein
MQSYYVLNVVKMDFFSYIKYVQILGLWIILSIASMTTYGQEYTQPQNRIKSIYIYNFIKDIQWPVLSGSEIKICLIENTSLQAEMEKLMADKVVDSKKLMVVKITSLANCNECNLIFIEEEEAKKHKLKRDANCNSLIVTGGFYDKNMSNIALIVQDNKLQYSINNSLCTALGYKVSQRLLGLANQKLIQQ